LSRIKLRVHHSRNVYCVVICVLLVTLFLNR